MSCIHTHTTIFADEDEAYENITIVTRSHPDAFPSALRQKGRTQTKVHESEDALLKVRNRSE